MLFANTDIPRIIPCKPEGNTKITRSITAFAYDSRRIVDSKGVLFFALKGKSNDGHQHIQKAYDQGIRDFVISDNACIKDTYVDASFFVVDNTLDALQNLSKHIRSNRKARILAITGSNGKTICKEWLWQLSNGDTFRSPLSYNSQIGVPSH